MNNAILFSQGSLQAYSDCPRRYQLRYLLTQPWPAILTTSPREVELHMQRGADFHHLMHQHYAGVAPSQLADTIEGDHILRRWWETYLRHPPTDLPSVLLRPEVVLSAPLAGHRLLARLDLLAIEPGVRAVAIDWKTSRKRPARPVLAQRLQTRLYRYLLVAAAPPMEGQPPLEAEQAELVYWFCELDGVMERFPYTADQYAADKTLLSDLIGEIVGRREAIWPLTPDEERCRTCSYHSLCERRASPAFSDDELDSDLDEHDADIEQIAEVAF